MANGPGSRSRNQAATRPARADRRDRKRQDEALYRELVECAPDAILVHQEGRIRFVNRRAVTLLGATGEADLIGRPALELIAPAQRAEFTARLAALQIPGEVTEPLEQEIRRLDGGTIEAEVRTVAITTGDRPAVQTVLRDVTERKRAEAKIWHLSHHDALTGLPNRALFGERLDQALLARPADSRVAVLCLDLNGLKGINETLGHAVGDALLCDVAECLRACVGEADLVARLGDDEFAVIHTEAPGSEASTILAERLIDGLGQPFLVGAQELHSAVCVGIAHAPEHGDQPDILLRHADIALCRARECGGGSYRVYQPAMYYGLQLRREIERDLRVGLEKGQFSLQYQPQFDLWSGEIVGIEALLRWAHPTRGRISPEAFVPIAEEAGLIVPLGEWVLRTACAQARRWLDQGLPPARLAVNLSPAQFALSDVVALIERVLQETGLPPTQLELEITEGILMRDTENMIATLRRLHARGVTLSVDDFGTGYSSLSYLKRFPLDKLKIDRYFVRDVPTDPDDVAIARAVITLAHALQLKVSAEGVETAATLAFLKAEGCDEAQGFYLSCPVDPDCCGELLARLGKGRQKSARALPVPNDATVVLLRPKARLHGHA